MMMPAASDLFYEVVKEEANMRRTTRTETRGCKEVEPRRALLFEWAEVHGAQSQLLASTARNIRPCAARCQACVYVEV